MLKPGLRFFHDSFRIAILPGKPIPEPDSICLLLANIILSILTHVNHTICRSLDKSCERCEHIKI